MSIYKYIAAYLQRSPVSCAAIYFVVMLALFTTCWLWIMLLQDQRASLASATEILERLQSRSASLVAADSSSTEKSIAPGSPFLEGQTVTVAGAGLLERVSRAVMSVGGRVLSSQVDLQPSRSNPGFVSVIINCEIDQLSLQKLLFDLEAGMPFLFINQLEIQASDPSSSSQAAAMHVLLTASSQWLGKQ